jgi:hypothetical protein
VTGSIMVAGLARGTQAPVVSRKYTVPPASGAPTATA